MNTLRNSFAAIALFAAFVCGTASLAEAQKRSDKDVRDAVRSLNSKLDDFESHLRFQMQSSSSTNGQGGDIADAIRTMRDNVGYFQDNFDRKRENADDVRAIVDSTRPINDFLRVNPQNRTVEDDWRAVQAQLDRLSSNYGVTNKWNGARYPQSGNTNSSYPPPVQTIGMNAGFSGTYDLDRTRSENVDDILTDAKVANDQRQDLKDKLDSPEQIAIDIRGSQVTLATTNSSPITFTADGREKTETSASGKTVRNRVSLNGQVMTVSSLGGETDYTITFTSVSNGQGLKVSRRITTDYLSQTVFAESVYSKTDVVAKLGIPAGGANVPNAPSNTDPNGGYSDNDNSGGVANGGSPNNGRPTYNGNRPVAVQVKPGNYVVPNGTSMTGILENDINTKVSQNNDRFRMTVQSPDEFRGATIEGYVSGINRSGKITGRSNVTLNFEKITLRNGTTYDFAGTTRSITDATGKIIQVDNEGTIRGDNQTTQTAKRGGAGAGLGAIIGAIAGGGHGAVIGAIIGGGVGAGSVAIQGNSDVQLMKGSVVSIQAAAPAQLSSK